MCQRKPGARCSSDAKKTILSVAEEVREAEDAFRNAKFAIARSDPDQELDMQLGDARRELFKALAKMNDANLFYNATPEGIKSLEKLLAVSGDSITLKTYELDSIESGQPGLTKVRIELPTEKLLKAKLSLAKDHRAAQSYALEKLTEAELVSPEKAVLLAEVLLKESQDNLTNKKRNIVFWRDEFRKSAADFYHSHSDEDKKKARVAGINEATEKADQIYTQSRFDDLQDYLKSARKHLAA